LLKILAPCLLAAIFACAAHRASAQTPSPMQEWQYSGGMTLENLFEPKIPRWSVILGGATSTQPAYSGASQYRTSFGPVVNIVYRNRVFLASGEGLGVNVFEGKQYRVSLSVGLDLGRRMSWHYATLHGLGDIPRAAFFKLAGTYVISKRFPVLLRADIRKIAGGASGLVADAEIYTPLPGSSHRFVMFAGPSVTFADRQHLQVSYGIDPLQARRSGYPVYQAHAGLQAAGIGFSATRFITPHLLVNTNLAASWLLGSAGESPVVERRFLGTFSLSTAYRW
jgi:outer membrane scaffolding protein for murein synthesis (MipA/OmpV family)